MMSDYTDELHDDAIHHSVMKSSTDKITALRAEVERLKAELKIKSAGDNYAHRLAIMLECALIDPVRNWNDGHDLLDEYREACRAAYEPPTFMGEPVVWPTAEGEEG